MHRGLPTEKIYLSPQFYQHIFTSLTPQMWKVSCKSGIREKFLAWPTTNHSDDPLERLGSSCQHAHRAVYRRGNKWLSFGFLFSLAAFLHNFFFFFFFWAEIKTSDSWHCEDKSVQEAFYRLLPREILCPWFTGETKSSSAVTLQYRKMLASSAAQQTLEMAILGPKCKNCISLQSHIGDARQ